MGDNVKNAHQVGQLRKAYIKGKQAGVYYLKNNDLSGARVKLEALKRQYLKTKSLEDKKVYDGFKRATAHLVEKKKTPAKAAALNPFKYSEDEGISSDKNTKKYLADKVSFDKKKRIKVLILSNFDYGGSGWMIKQALESTGLVSVVHVRGRKHKYGYPADFDINIHDKQDRYFLRKLANSADIIHFKGDYPPSKVLGGVGLSFGKPMFITVGGSLFRRSPKSTISKRGLFEENLYLRDTTGRFALTADLNYPWYRGMWVPAPIAVPSTNLWVPPAEGEAIRIGHSPSNRAKKGTNETFLPSIKILKDKGFNIEPVLLENMSHKECVEAKRNLHMFWDQSKVGFYGNSALESMRYGIPTVCRISKQSSQQAGHSLVGCPIFSFDDNPVSSAMAIERAITSGLDRESEKIYSWTKRVHSIESVGRLYLEEYLKKLSFKI